MDDLHQENRKILIKIVTNLLLGKNRREMGLNQVCPRIVWTMNHVPRAVQHSKYDEFIIQL